MGNSTESEFLFKEAGILKEVERSAQLLFGGSLVTLFVFVGQIWNEDISARLHTLNFIMMTGLSFIISIGMTWFRIYYMIWFSTSKVRENIAQYSWLTALVMCFCVFVYGGFEFLSGLNEVTVSQYELLLERTASPEGTSDLLTE